MTDLLKRFADYYRPYRGPFVLDFSSAMAAGLLHQLDVMTIVRALAREGRIVVMVLDDLTLAATRADHLIVLNRGRIAAEGRPETALTPSIRSADYSVEARIVCRSRGRPHIMVGGPAIPSEVRHAG